MKIAVLGTGSVGRTIAGRLAELGHDVVIGTRDPAATLARTEPDGMGNPPYAAWAGEHADVALAHLRRRRRPTAELVVNASSGAAALDVLAGAGAENLAGKVLLDIANPLDFSAGFPPTLAVKDTDSLGEQIQRAYPDVRVVKSLNTLTADLMAHPDHLAEASTVFVSGEDAEAKATVTELPEVLRPPGRHRPRRHRDRPRHRDAAAGVAAADGRAGHRAVQLQDRPLRRTTPGPAGGQASASALIPRRVCCMPSRSSPRNCCWPPSSRRTKPSEILRGALRRLAALDDAGAAVGGLEGEGPDREVRP